MTVAKLQCIGLTKRFGGVVAAEGLDLSVQAGSLMAILGASGCGKTTTLRLVAGFERPDGGRILIDGREVSGPGVFVPPEGRRVGVVFQDYALFPHLSVWKNVAYGVRGRVWGRGKRRRVDEMVDLVGLGGLGGRYPDELSGGQRQRVALARALAPGPELVLLDEPFASLDSTTRASVRTEVRRILHVAGATAVMVTHDQQEAFSVADEVAVMSEGCIEQVGPPHEVYSFPRTTRLARFLGDGNILPARTEGGRVRCSLGLLNPPSGGCGPCEGEQCRVLVRPESIKLAPEGVGVPASVEESSFYGHDQTLLVRLEDGCMLRVRLWPDRKFKRGERVWLRCDEGVVVYPTVEGARLADGGGPGRG